jgi:hypothetical protein
MDNSTGQELPAHKPPVSRDDASQSLRARKRALKHAPTPAAIVPGNSGVTECPFQIVRSYFGACLAAKLSTIEYEDKFEPHTQFVSALNRVLDD